MAEGGWATPTVAFAGTPSSSSSYKLFFKKQQLNSNVRAQLGTG